MITLLPYAVGAAAGWFIVPALTADGMDGGRSSLATAGAFGAMSAFVVNCWIAPRLQKPQVANDGVFCGSLTLTWNENAMTTSVGGSTRTILWSAVSGITETDLTLFLQVDFCEAIVIPLSVFEDKDDLAAFKAYAEAQIAAT